MSQVFGHETGTFDVIQPSEAADSDEKWSQDDPIFRWERQMDFRGYPLIIISAYREPKSQKTAHIRD